MKFSKAEKEVLNIYLNANPCQSGCAWKNMSESTKDCDECEMERVRGELLNKIDSNIKYYEVFYSTKLDSGRRKVYLKAESKQDCRELFERLFVNDVYQAKKSSVTIYEWHEPIFVGREDLE